MVGNPEAMRVAERFTHAIVSLDVDAVGYRPNIVVRRSATEVDIGNRSSSLSWLALGIRTAKQSSVSSRSALWSDNQGGHRPVPPRQP